MKREKEKDRVFADKGACRRRVNLARVQIEGLGDGELATALAYEVEPYSHIPAAEAQVAWKESESGDPAIRMFEVAVVRRRAERSVGGMERCLGALVILGVLALAALAADFAYMKYRFRALEESLSRRAPLQRELDALAAKASKAKNRAAAIRSAREDAVKAQAECARLRGAHLGFLQALSGLGGKAVVKSIAPGKEPFSLAFALAAVDERSGSEVMTGLTAELARRGWELSPGDVTGAGNGEIVVFNAEARFGK